LSPRSGRRLFVAGMAGAAGISLADLLAADSARAANTAGAARLPTAGGPRARSILNVHLDGGPPQMDTFDMKPDGPAEVRGEFRPIATAVPGVAFCEHLPKLAALAGSLCVLRGLTGSAGQHDAFQCQSGYAATELASLGGWPAVGSVLAHLWGSPSDTAPPFVDLMQGRGLARSSARPGFLGPALAPFRPDIGGLFERPLEAGMQRELAARGEVFSTALALDAGLPAGRLEDRRGLLRALDRWKRRVDSAGVASLDRFHDQAVGILTSGRVAEALDLDRERPSVTARYRLEGPEGPRFETADSSRATLKFLLARRLLEAGVRCVSLSLSDFDTHASNFPRMRHLLPILDTGLSALIEDLADRGMLEEVVIVVWGEFGRTPRINGQGGRDHWPAVSPALLAGGGIRGGVVHGQTDRWAGSVTGGAVSYQDVVATLYHLVGLDPAAALLKDTSGRPHPLVERGRPIREILA
jgi:hypothetical protein